MGKSGLKIETSRLILREFEPKFEEFMLKNWACDYEVVRFLVYDICQNMEDVRARLDDWYKYFHSVQGEWMLFAIELKATGEIIGTIDFAETDAGVRSAEIGYQLGKAWWGQGLMTEALSAVIKHCFERVGLWRVWANHDPRNAASGRVLQKAGMLLEGTLRNCALRRGELVSRTYYSILRNEYFGTGMENNTITPCEK